MKIAAAVLTRNQFDHERCDLFEQTVESLTGVEELFVVDNGSTDGTDAFIKDGPWRSYCSTAANTTSGYGTWLCCRILAATDADICIVSDDDMRWHDGFTEPLRAWYRWGGYTVITGGHLEPEFFWNKIEYVESLGPADARVTGLIRASTGAASWTFLRDKFPFIAKRVARIPIDRQGTWDVPVCKALHDDGHHIGQLDLAEHLGRGRSSWGNGTESMYGWDTAPVRALL